MPTVFCDDFDCTFQNFKFSNAFDSLDVRLWLGPNWDLYVMTFLLGVLGLLFLIVQQARWTRETAAASSIFVIDYRLEFLF